MQEEIELYLEECKEKMEKSVNHLAAALTHIRAGKANTKLLDGVMVDYYGSLTPLSQVSNLSTPDAKTIAIQPWEKQLIPEIEKAIMNANLGFNPDNNGEMVRINIPALTEERRRDLTKQVRQEGEDAKVTLRNIRRDTNEAFKAMQKDGLSEDLEKDAEADVQKITAGFSKKIETLVEEKEQDIMTV
jgi:ribosome recycling factor